MAFPPFHPDTASLVRKHLTPELYGRLKGLRTPAGVTLDEAMRSGLAHSDSSVGIYAGDSDSFALFSEIFTPIIRDYHGPDAQAGHVRGMSPQDLPALDPQGKYIRSVRVRVARNLAGFPFTSHITRADRLAMEEKVMTATAAFPRDIAGQYTRFSELSPEALERLTVRKLAFPKGDRFQEAAGMNRDFPAGRGIFLSSDRTFRIWVNEEDHLRVMTQAQTPDLSQVFNLLVLGLDHLGRTLNFSSDPSLGYLNACPTNLGTAMRAGVHIHLPCLGKIPKRLRELVRDHHLQIRGTRGEKTAVENNVFDISNARRLGLSANQIIQDLCQGLLAVIHAEQSL